MMLIPIWIMMLILVLNIGLLTRVIILDKKVQDNANNIGIQYDKYSSRNRNDYKNSRKIIQEMIRLQDRESNPIIVQKRLTLFQKMKGIKFKSQFRNLGLYIHDRSISVEIYNFMDDQFEAIEFLLDDEVFQNEFKYHYIWR